MLGVVRRVLRDPAQSEEVAQEVLVEVWRTAPRFDPARGSATTWVVNRWPTAGRSTGSGPRRPPGDRERRRRGLDQSPEFDEVSEAVEASLERRGRSQGAAIAHRAPARGGLAGVLRRLHPARGGRTARRPLGTVKTRLRDGLLRLRDALGVTS